MTDHDPNDADDGEPPTDNTDEIMRDLEASREEDRPDPEPDPAEPISASTNGDGQASAGDGGAAASVTLQTGPSSGGRDMEAYINFLDVYYQDEMARLAQRFPNDQRTIEFDWVDIRQGYPEAAEAFLNESEQVITELGEAVANYDLPVDIDLSDAEVQIVNLPEHKQYDVGLYSPKRLIGETVELRGQVAKRTGKKPIKDEAAFECQRCGTLTYIPQSGDEFLDEPNQCQGCERQGPFVVIGEESVTSDYQLIRLKQPPELTRGGSGETVDVQVRNELCDVAEAGDRIRVTSTVRERQERKGQQLKRTGEVYAQAHGIVLEEHDWSEVEIEKHRDQIEEIANSGEAFERIVDSIYPSHYGDRRVKKAMALQMFGGVDKKLQDDRTRGTIHIGLIGDPATNKSGLLTYAEKMTPRSIFTSGKGSTSTGLTAAAVQDEFGDGGWSIEAGAVVRADGGLCCIDELDKMEMEDQNGLLEAMSNQKVSFAKAGKEGNLPANTSILAAANPKAGRFDMYDDLAEQFDFHPALISRFDLLFTFSDVPEQEKDRKLARHKTDSAIVGQKKAAGMELTEEEEDIEQPDISTDVMRAYIAMGRDVYPVLTEEAREKLEDDYVGLRGIYDDEEEDAPVPVTVRKLDALVRLSEASARMRLSNRITAEDAERALDVHRACLEDIGIDPNTGEFDADIVEAGRSKSQAKRRMLLQNVVEELTKQQDTGGAPFAEVIEAMADEGYEQDKVEHDIAHFKEHGQLYEPADDELLLT